MKEGESYSRAERECPVVLGGAWDDVEPRSNAISLLQRAK
jgi:hypothetical protein